MACTRFPVIDPAATGRNILRLRQERGYTVRDLQQFFGFEEPQAIYKWQRGQSLPSIDNLYALSHLFQISMNEILVPVSPIYAVEQQASACCSTLFIPYDRRTQGVWQTFGAAWALIRRSPGAPRPRKEGERLRLSRRLHLIHPSGEPETEGDVFAGLCSDKVCGGSTCDGA